MSEENIDKDVEGLDEQPSESWGDYPLDTVFVRKDARTVGDVVNRIKKGRYKLDPEFQRDFVWSPLQQARLIESSLMRIPLPVLYVAEDTDGKIIVVDGLQRLTTFFKYLEDEFSLKNIGSNDPDSLIRNKKFSELPIHLQERIEDTQLTLYILDSKAPERARLDIFERVNSGVPLTRQQMRNCLYSGPATRWLKKASEDESFLHATGGSLKSKSMRDREVINRFCAFYILGSEGYKGDMEEYLAEALSTMNRMSAEDLGRVFEEFKNAMDLSATLFGKHSFRKSLAKRNGDNSKSVLNISLFDALAVSLSKNYSKLTGIAKGDLVGRVATLLSYDTFMDSISLSTNNSNKVRCRHDLLEMVLGKHLESDVSQIVFYDTLKTLLPVYRLDFEAHRLFILSGAVNGAYREVSKYTDWSKRDDLRSEFQSKCIVLLNNEGASESQVKMVAASLFSEAKSIS
ncbi:DUF262 domain-containing protein [uncultured Pseudoteredinibacter sp.]|uniref:DUF262 domain-containing protein n=1 Tax=uncultured Pseudoteredinibacter sp. TaxID=1641701 RepID=UPI00261F585E|nr:DUF262 domain-containing protein [uncultured Pseudoteredinibacter sp.]